MFITKKPSRFVFAGNPMRYLLSADQGGGLPDGQCSVVEMVFSDVDHVADHSMNVQISGESRSFTLKETPTRGDELPVAPHSFTPEQWAQACFTYLMDDVSIATNYLLDIQSSTITLVARAASPQFDIALVDSTIQGIALNTIQNGMAPDNSTVEGVLLQVWKDGTDKIGEDYKPVDANGQVRFEIQEYIYSHLKMALPPRFRLSMPGGLYRYYYDYILKYRTVFCDKIDGVFSDRSYCDPDNVYCYALPGGLNRQGLSANNEALVDFFSLAAVKKKFLSWSPPSRLTDKAETISLFFAFQQPAFTAFRLRAHVYDSFVGETIDLTPLIAVQPWNVIEVVGGYSQLNLENYLSGGVIRWELWLTDDQNNPISETREFVLDPQYHENVRYFRFRNSWGTYDSLRCTGTFEFSVEHEREKVIFTPEDPETQFNAPGSHSLIRELQTFKANTGWMDKTHLNYLRDFMLSGDIYEVENSWVLKCLLTSKKTTLFRDKNYNYSIAFEYERANEDFFFQT